MGKKKKKEDQTFQQFQLLCIEKKELLENSGSENQDENLSRVKKPRFRYLTDSKSVACTLSSRAVPCSEKYFSGVTDNLSIINKEPELRLLPKILDEKYDPEV